MIRIALAISLLSLVLSASASAAGPVASAAKTCSLTTKQEFHSGATYLTQLKVVGVSCATGLKVEKAYQSCRRQTAGHMVCRKHVLGYRCTQKLIDQSKIQYDARVTCKSGSRSVNFVYTQNK